MLSKAVGLWVIGLLTIVPYGIYYLFFEAPRDEYALVITVVLFWVFGFWGVAGPILSAVKIRRVIKAIETAQRQGRLMELVRSKDTAEMAIDLIASENKIPRFLATRVYRLLLDRCKPGNSAPG